MSLQDEFEEDVAWAAATPTAPGDILRGAMKKEAIVNDIVAAQEDLRVLLARVNTVQGEVDKLTSGNETLQMYVDNLAKQLAVSKK